MSSVIKLFSYILLGKAADYSGDIGIREVRDAVALDGGQQLLNVDDMVLRVDVRKDGTTSKHHYWHHLQVGPVFQGFLYGIGM